MVEDLCTTAFPPEPPPGPQAPLSRSAVGTLALFGQGPGFGSARGFSRSAQPPLRAALPQLPVREPGNRPVRHPPDALVAFVLPLVPRWAAQRWAAEGLDSSGLPPRAATRRGAGGLPGVADMGWSKRLGWYAGCPLLLAVPPVGVIPGFGFGAASTQEPPLADTVFALRRQPQPGLPRVGAPAAGP
jgi:hypothetical protein